MSKSSMIVMAILLMAFGSMLLAADLMIAPIEQDLGLAREMIAELDHRGWLEEEKPRPDTRVRVRTTKGGEGRLMEKPDWGLIVEVSPSADALKTANRLSYMTSVIVERIDASSRGGKTVHWIELVLKTEGEEILRTLIRRDGGAWSAPEPPIPAVWDPSRNNKAAPTGPPKPPAAPSSSAPRENAG